MRAVLGTIPWVWLSFGLSGKEGKMLILPLTLSISLHCDFSLGLDLKHQIRQFLLPWPRLGHEPHSKGWKGHCLVLSTASGNAQNVSASRSPSRNLAFLVKYVSSIQKKNRILLSTECSNNIFVNWFLIQASENNMLIRKGCHSLQEHMHNIQQKMRLSMLLQMLQSQGLSEQLVVTNWDTQVGVPLLSP